jgi:hypothetical protein
VRLLPPMVTTDERFDQAIDFALLKVGDTCQSNS